MMTNKVKKHNRSKIKGLSLVEIVVALGISILTLTSGAVMSNTIVERAQVNFLEESAIQLQGLVTEQLRIVELGLREAVTAGRRAGGAGTIGQVQVTGLDMNETEWANFCSAGNMNFISINLPDPNNVGSSASISPNATTPSPVQPDGDAASRDNPNSYFRPDNSSANIDWNNQRSFNPFDGANIDHVGAFARDNTNDVRVAIYKTVDTSSDTITLRTVVRYRIFSQDHFTNVRSVQMVGALVCGA